MSKNTLLFYYTLCIVLTGASLLFLFPLTGCNLDGAGTHRIQNLMDPDTAHDDSETGDARSPGPQLLEPLSDIESSHESVGGREDTIDSDPAEESGHNPHKSPLREESPPPYGRSIWENPTWKGAVLPESDSHVSPRTAEINSIRTTNSTVTGTSTDNASPSAMNEIPSGADRNPRNSSGNSTGSVGVPVLCYHHTFSGNESFGGYNIQPDRLERQFQQLLAEGYRSISLEQFTRAMRGERRGLPEKPVLITFDDGLLSNYTEAWPLLKKYNLRAVLFLYPTILSAGKSNYLNWDQARTLARSDLIEIGSHTLWHPLLPSMSDGEIEKQLVESRRTLQTRLGVSVTALAYPFGVYDTRVLTAVRKAGYDLAFTIQPGENLPGDDVFTLNRYMVTGSQSPATFQAMLALRSVDDVRITPADGEYVRFGESIQIRTENMRNVSAQLNGKVIALQNNGAAYRGRLPESQTSRGYLPLVIRGRDARGNSVYREFLYLEKTHFAHNQ